MNQFNLFVLLILICSVSSYGQIQSKSSIAETLKQKSYDNIDIAIDYYHQLKKDHFSAYNFGDENELNNLGYQLLADNRVVDAIKIFKLLVKEFPDAFNPYDSLGEAYFINGDYQLATKSYQRSLSLNAENKNAEKMIMDIRFKTRDKGKFSILYPVNYYKEDLQELAKTLTQTNPHPYKFISRDRFWEIVEEKKNLITDTTTYATFIWHCSEIVANINCGHSAIVRHFQQEDEMMPDSLRFPLEVRLIDGRLYIVDGLVNKDQVAKGQEIFSINGKSIEEITTDIFRHISTQGKVESAYRHSFNFMANSMIPYAMGFPEVYELVVKGRRLPIRLNPLKSYDLNPSTNASCNERLCLSILEEEQTAKLTIKTWAYYGNQFPVFKKFIDESFERIYNEGISNLIIDVRNNGGGASDAGIYLLRYLSAKPFSYYKSSAFNEKKEPVKPFVNRYKGNLFFLIDGGGGSVTGHVLSLVKHHKLGTLIGEELGSNIFATGGQKTFSLTHTNVFYCVGRYTYVADADSVSDVRGVFPDHNIVQGIDDYLNGVDTMLEYTLRLINAK